MIEFELYNKYRAKREIILIDDIDADLLKYNWVIYIKNTIQAYVNGTNRTLHRIIADRMGYSGKHIKHSNGNPFDNQRCNIILRSLPRLSKPENNYDPLASKMSRYKKEEQLRSKYYGVYYHPYGNRNWRAKVKYNGKWIYSEYFDTELEAANAHDEVAVMYHGSTAFLNFPENFPNPDKHLIVELPDIVKGKRYVKSKNGNILTVKKDDSDRYPPLNDLLED